MTEAQAWREIARRYVEGKRYGKTGLCREVAGLYAAGEIDSLTKADMQERTYEHVDAMAGAPLCFAWEFGPGRDEPRTLAALFLALEAEDES